MNIILGTNFVQFDAARYEKGTLDYSVAGTDAVLFTRSSNGSVVAGPVKYSDVINPNTSAPFVSLIAFTNYLDAGFFNSAASGDGSGGGVGSPVMISGSFTVS